MARWWFVALLAGCPAGRSGAPEPALPVEVPVVAVNERTCIERFELTNDQSVLSEHRQHAAVRDFHEAYPAAAIDPEAQAPVALTARFQAGGTPLLWYTADKVGVVVNQAALSELHVVDTTNLGVGEVVVVGRVTELAKPLISGRDLVRFLLESRAIATWVHIGSSLCLAGEETTPEGTYAARFTGTHTYFTNEENVRPLKFEVLVGADGEIRVRGGR